MKKTRKDESDGEKMLAENAMQRSRGKYLKKPPANLEWLIWLTNKVPPDVELPDLDAAIGEEGKVLLVKGEHKEYRAKELEAVLAIVEKLPKSLSDFILHDPDFCLAANCEAFRHFADTYRFFQSLRRNILQVAAMGRFMRCSASHHLASLFPLRLEGVSVLLKPDGKGFRAISNPLVEALIDPDVEAERVRQCEVCERIFWAGRIDAQQCGAAKCKSALSSRLNRNPKLRELYNKARRTKRRKQKEVQSRKTPTKKGK